MGGGRTPIRGMRRILRNFAKFACGHGRRPQNNNKEAGLQRKVLSALCFLRRWQDPTCVALSFPKRQLCVTSRCQAEAILRCSSAYDARHGEDPKRSRCCGASPVDEATWSDVLDLQVAHAHIWRRVDAQALPGCPVHGDREFARKPRGPHMGRWGARNVYPGSVAPKQMDNDTAHIATCKPTCLGKCSKRSASQQRVASKTPADLAPCPPSRPASQAANTRQPSCQQPWHALPHHKRATTPVCDPAWPSGAPPDASTLDVRVYAAATGSATSRERCGDAAPLETHHVKNDHSPQTHATQTMAVSAE